MMDLSLVIDFTKQAEGEVRLQNGNHKLYKCPADYFTIGYGYNIQANGLPENIAEILLHKCLADSEYHLSQNISNWHELSLCRQSVLIDMCFNLGWPTLRTFKNMLFHVENGVFDMAADEMVKSKWYRQVGIRAKKLVKSMESDEWQTYS